MSKEFESYIQCLYIEIGRLEEIQKKIENNIIKEEISKEFDDIHQEIYTIIESLDTVLNKIMVEKKDD